MDSSQPMIRAILAPLVAESILVPSNVVAEVIEFTKPAPYVNSPAWLLGDLEWNGWQVPIISYAILAGLAQRDPVSSASRILVIKTLAEDTSLYYLGILIKGLPKLKKLLPESVEPVSGKQASDVVFSRVTLDGQPALVPALEALVKQVAATVHE